MKYFIYKLPFAITIFSIFGGVLIAIVFGINEDYIKDKISVGLEKNTAIQAIEDPLERSEKLKSEAKKNWRYYQRYHFHSNGIAAMTLGLLLLLSFLQLGKYEYLVSSYLLAVGGSLYPFVWLFAGIYGPVMGRSNAKEAFAILGYMGGAYLIGVVYTLYLSLAKDRSLNLFNNNFS